MTNDEGLDHIRPKIEVDDKSLIMFSHIQNFLV